MLNTILEPPREIALVDDYDVVVAGGGTAGIIATVAAARNGMRVLLLERSGFLGGHIASQLLEHSAGWFDAIGRRIVGGLPGELVDRLKEAGASPGHVRDDTGYTKFRVPVNHEAFKSVVTEWIAEAGADFLLFSPVCRVLTGDGRIAALVVENKSGRTAYAAKAVVDCTGDADVAALAQCRFLGSGETGQTQPVSLLFKIGGLNFSDILDYVEHNPQDFKLGVKLEELRGEPYVNLWGFGQCLRRAHDDGVLSFRRAELHFAGIVAEREAVINLTRYAIDATDSKALAEAERALRRQVLECVAFFRRYVPGCAKAHLVATASCVGVRESRRIEGLYTLKDDDVRAGRHFEDDVVLGGFPIDSHDPKGASMDGAEHVPQAYGIPYRALVPQAVDGLLVAGRCISAERRALASARITGTCMAMGQAAGTAAALAIVSGSGTHRLDVGRLQERLGDQGAIFRLG